MKTTAELFREHPELLEHTPVQDLVREYEDVCDALIDLEQVAAMNKEKPLKVLIKEIQESIAQTKKHNEEADRFGYEDKLDYQEAVFNLERYIARFLKDHQIYL